MHENPAWCAILDTYDHRKPQNFLPFLFLLSFFFFFFFCFFFGGGGRGGCLSLFIIRAHYLSLNCKKSCCCMMNNNTLFFLLANYFVKYIYTIYKYMGGQKIWSYCKRIIFVLTFEREIPNLILITSWLIYLGKLNSLEENLIVIMKCV